MCATSRLHSFHPAEKAQILQIDFSAAMWIFIFLALRVCLAASRSPLCLYNSRAIVQVNRHHDSFKTDKEPPKHTQTDTHTHLPPSDILARCYRCLLGSETCAPRLSERLMKSMCVRVNLLSHHTNSFPVKGLDYGFTMK